MKCMSVAEKICELDRELERAELELKGRVSRAGLIQHLYHRRLH